MIHIILHLLGKILKNVKMIYNLLLILKFQSRLITIKIHNTKLIINNKLRIIKIKMQILNTWKNHFEDLDDFKRVVFQISIEKFLEKKIDKIMIIIFNNLLILIALLNKLIIKTIIRFLILTSNQKHQLGEIIIIHKLPNQFNGEFLIMQNLQRNQFN